MAYGFEKPILMLAHSPYVPPVDYKDLLQVHSTAASCISSANLWLAEIETSYLERRSKVQEHATEIQSAVVLQSINLGEDIAENEQQQDLLEYFIPTAIFQEAIRTPQSVIYVGRKGTGKTATLYKVADTLRKDPRNHVCIIKPVAYELEGVLELLRSSISKAEQGYMLESLWKFLVYTELAQSVVAELEAKPPHYVRRPEEEQLCKYVDEYSDLVRLEFTVRMERILKELCQIDATQPIMQQRSRVSEILHSKVLQQLREILGRALQKRERVCVLIDNLDKAWTRDSNLALLSDFLFGLLSVSRAISEEYQRSGVSWRQVRLSLLIFLRSDIFEHIMRVARERDKLVFRRLDWNDHSLLQNVIEERFMSKLDSSVLPDEIWTRFFVERVNQVHARDYITNHIIPRPRDMIYFCKAALARAVNLKHTIVEEIDILKAEEQYSHYAFNALEAETGAQLEHLEKLAYQFVGVDEIVTRDQIVQFAEKAGIALERTQYVIDLLCEATFLGLETGKDRFEFMYDENREEVIRALARKIAEATGQERFLINLPFHSFLEINKG